ncbi:hypothetical protein AB5J62_33390 [Amycolatopsis sp. cg5]|uniref:hypothetical protein n=1 Tax=Amycolatopsis sp. cg5 TaxID=3238802 RepID=UPI0035244E5B
MKASTVAGLAVLESCVTELPDDELRELADIVENLSIRVRTEIAARRRGRTPRRPSPAVVTRLRSRASCVFCRRVYVADLIAEHLLLDHHDDLRAWRRPAGRAA